eukprot:scaffold248282_cov89-Cyclotella_meneghiniana.AAC.1
MCDVDSVSNDVEQDCGPKVGNSFFVNNEDASISDISQGMTTAIGFAVDDQVHLCQVHLSGLERLGHENIGECSFSSYET